jgi:hypothetical protein
MRETPFVRLLLNGGKNRLFPLAFRLKNGGTFIPVGG